MDNPKWSRLPVVRDSDSELRFQIKLSFKAVDHFGAIVRKGHQQPRPKSEIER
jgi:hypothetical protein